MSFVSSLIYVSGRREGSAGKTGTKSRRVGRSRFFSLSFLLQSSRGIYTAVLSRASGVVYMARRSILYSRLATLSSFIVRHRIVKKYKNETKCRPVPRGPQKPYA